MNKKTKTAPKRRVKPSVPRQKPKVKKNGLVKDKTFRRVKGSNEAIRCGLNPFSGSIVATINSANLRVYARAIVSLLNDSIGIVPTTGTVNVPAGVYYYIEMCLLAYLAKVGTIVGSSAEVVAFQKYYVPNWLAVLFQHCAPYYDSSSKASFTLSCTDFTYDIVSAQSTTEGLDEVCVATGNSAAYNGEPTFGVGAVVTLTSYTEAQFSELSELIAASGKAISVSKIGNRAPSHQGIVGYHGVTIKSFETIRPSPACASQCALMFVTAEHIGEFVTFSVPIKDSPDTNATVNSYLIQSLYAYYGRDLHLTTSTDVAISKVWYDKVGDPTALCVVRHPVSFSKMAGLLLDWMRRTGLLKSFSTSESSRFGTLCAYWWGALSARSPFVCRPQGTLPQYISKELMMAMLPPCVAENGYYPTRVRNSIYLPEFATAVNACHVAWQPGTVAAFANFNSGPNSWPVVINTGGNAVSVGTTFAGLVPPAANTIFNQTPLTMIEEIESWLVNSSDDFNAQTIPYPTIKPACPCDASYGIGTNTDTVGNLIIYYPAHTAMSCSRPVGALECDISMSCGLFVYPLKSLFWSRISSVSQNPYRKAVNAGLLQNNLSIFSAAGGSTNDPIKAFGKLFNSEILHSLPTEIVEFDGSYLIDMAHAFLDEGGDPYPVPGEAWLKSLEKGVKDISPLVAQTAGVLGQLSAGGMAVLKGYNAIRGRVAPAA